MDTTVAAPSKTGSRPSRRFPRPVLYGGLVVVGVVLVCLVLLVGLRVSRPGALPGVHVGEVDVGGLRGPALTEMIAAAGREDDTITVVLGDERLHAIGAELGYAHDVAATEEAVLRRGRQWNPIAALTDHVRAFSERPLVVARVDGVNDEQLRAWVADAADTLSREPVEGTLEFDGAEITRVDPAPGYEVRADELESMLRDALLADGGQALEAPAERLEPDTSAEAVARVYVDAERALSGPLTLTRGEAALVLEPDALGGLLTVQRDGAELALVADADGLDALVDDDLRAEFERDPGDAGFTISGDTVEVVPAEDGFRFDAEVAAEQVVDVATGDGPREVELAGEAIEPGFTTADAEALNIVERVSSFTTHFEPGQSRVTNIQRMADLIDGVLIAPGETFSVNDFVGPRTRDKGFVEGGAIFQGEFVSAVGGGVSQFATTMYNAAYFGGYDIPEFQPHSYYISRYPAGREATLNYPDIDLRVHNSSPHGILVQTSYTGSSITVTFWGTQWVEVDSVSGNPRNHRAPQTEVRDNADLPAGTERVVQAGRQGFDITVTRILRFPDGEERREEVTTRYLAEPRIVERGTRAPPEAADEPAGDRDEEPAEPDGAEPDGDGDGEPANGANGS
jgi:vancomycin resistance protein YoaR